MLKLPIVSFSKESKILMKIHASNVDNIVAVICSSNNSPVMEATMAEKPTHVERAYWYNTKEEKPQGESAFYFQVD